MKQLARRRKSRSPRIPFPLAMLGGALVGAVSYAWNRKPLVYQVTCSACCADAAHLPCVMYWRHIDADAVCLAAFLHDSTRVALRAVH